MVENLISVTDESFEEEVLNSTLPVLVDFWAPWCGPCRTFAPTFEEMAEKQVGKVKMAKMNVDEAANTAQKYHVKSVPTLILFKEGHVTATHVGSMTHQQLKSFLNENI